MKASGQQSSHYKEAALFHEAQAMKLVLTNQVTIKTQIRIAGDQGDLRIAARYPSTEQEAAEFFRQLGMLMAWRAATAFIWTSFVENPLGLYTCLISKTERHAFFRHFSFDPKPWTEANFSAIEWLPELAIKKQLANLLPTGPVPLTPKDVAALEPWFGRTGRYPAWHTKKGEIVGI